MGTSLSSISALAKVEVEGYDLMVFRLIQDGLCNTHATHVFPKDAAVLGASLLAPQFILQGVAPLTPTGSLAPLRCFFSFFRHAPLAHYCCEA